MGTIYTLQTIQEHLTQYSISVYSIQQQEFIVKGNSSKLKTIDLLYDEDVQHFDLIRSVTGFFNVSYYCRECDVASNDRFKHTCLRGCSRCGFVNTSKDKECKRQLNEVNIEKHCSDCNRWFYNPDCYANHTKNTTCSKVKRCQDCKALVDMKWRQRKSRKNHNCGEKYCSICKDYFVSAHLCYMTKPKEQVNSKYETKDKPLMYLFYDFEATQETEVSDKEEEFEHKVNFIVCKQR